MFTKKYGILCMFAVFIGSSTGLLISNSYWSLAIFIISMILLIIAGTIINAWDD